MPNNKIFNLIGLMHVAKKLVYGYDSVIKMREQNRLTCVLVGSSASYKTIKRIEEKMYPTKIPLYMVDETTNTISNALGKDNVKIVGVIDTGFSQSIKNSAQGE